MTISRITSLMSSNTLLSQLRATQTAMFKAEQQIATGQAFSRASQAPDKVSSVLFLEQGLDRRAQHAENLTFATGMLNTADQALTDVTNILLEARDVASSQIGIGSDGPTRQTEAVVIEAQLAAMMDLANTQFNDVALFGGTGGTGPGGRVFETFGGGVRYFGSDTNLQTDVGSAGYQDFASNGVDAFGAMSGRVRSAVDLGPGPAAATRLTDVGGVNGNGVAKGGVVVTVNGTDVAVDLSTADTLGDVVTRVNDAITSVSPGAGSLAISGNGFALTAAGGNTITISESGQGITALDLGIGLSATGATVAGPSVQTRLTLTTSLTDLATPVDWASGLLITQGQQTRTADFSAATTVEDLVNVIDGLGLGLRLEINGDGTGLDLVTDVSGLSLSIGENGGTTAQDLGLRTMGTNTSLEHFRYGNGVQAVTGEDDLTISLHDGTSFGVDLTGAQTVGQVISAIQTAAVGAGLTLGVDFDAGLATTGNGLVFDDLTAGGNDFVIAGAGTSLAGDHLGITGNAGAGSTITGTDEAQIRIENALTHLINLRDALLNNDTTGITLAGGGLEDDIDHVVTARATVGVQASRLQDEQQRAQDMEISEQSMLSTLQDADLTEVITRYTQLQTQLQASLAVGTTATQLSLLDYLR